MNTLKKTKSGSDDAVNGTHDLPSLTWAEFDSTLSHKTIRVFLDDAN